MWLNVTSLSNLPIEKEMEKRREERSGGGRGERRRRKRRKDRGDIRREEICQERREEKTKRRYLWWSSCCPRGSQRRYPGLWRTPLRTRPAAPPPGPAAGSSGTGWLLGAETPPGSVPPHYGHSSHTWGRRRRRGWEKEEDRKSTL